MLNENDFPTTVLFDSSTGIFEPCQKMSSRTLSGLVPMYHAKDEANAILAREDRLIYEIRYYAFETSSSDMALGVTRIFPGKIGDEYHMTKGHFHVRPDQPEIYYCVAGQGYLLMETHDGEFRAEPWRPGAITHIPPMWAHRVVNTGSDLLVFVASYHVAAGHDYDPVIKRGFAQRVVERNGKAVFVENEQRRNLD